MAKVLRLFDGLKNLVANLGTDRDKASHTTYCVLPMSDNQLADTYRASWLPRKIIDIPAQDACRRWREWQATAEQITKLEELEETLDLQGKVMDALKKARLFGGAAIYIGTNAADTSKPLQPTETIKHLTVITRRYLTANNMDNDPASETFGQPSGYTVANTAVVIHPTRLVIFYGVKLPDNNLATAQGQYGWGDSILTSVLDAVKSADSTVANVASLVFEAKVDVIKIPDFMSNLQDPEYEKQVISRVSLAARAKSINGMLLIDSEEDYQQKSVTFSSLKDILMAMMQVVSGASDIPMTRLLGMAPGGLQGTGDNDIRNYYDHISSLQELELSPALERLDNLLIYNALGSNPPDLWYSWCSLWQTTDTEKAENGNKLATTIKTLADTQLFDSVALGEAAVNVLVERGVLPGLDQAGSVAPETDTTVEEQGALPIVDGIARPLYVSRRVVNTADIIKWAHSQGIENVVEDLHVTVAYSKVPVDWMAVGGTWDQDPDGKIRIPPGGPRDMDIFGNGVTVLEFYCSALTWRHKGILEAGASWDWEAYKPHITITEEVVDLTKVVPYTGPIILGPEIFEDLKIGAQS